MSARASVYRWRAAQYAAKALAAAREHQDLFRELANAWRELAEREEALGSATDRERLRDRG